MPRIRKTHLLLYNLDFDKLMKIKVITFVSIWCLGLEIAYVRVFENSTGQLQVSFQFEYIRVSRMRFGIVTGIAVWLLGRSWR